MVLRKHILYRLKILLFIIVYLKFISSLQRVMYNGYNIKGNNSDIEIFTSLISGRGATFKGKNLLLLEQILPFKSSTLCYF